MRAFWSGEIAFGLVTIPSKLYAATKDLTPQFHQLHKECGTRINLVRRCPKCNRDLAWEEIGKGYEVAKGEYALFTKEELAKLDGEDAAGTIEIVEFVDPLEVDLAYIEKSYWVGPGSKNVRGYDLLRTVLEETKKVALAKVKLRTRSRLALLRPRGRLFSLDMMRFAEELIPGDELAPAEQKAPSPRERQLAEHLVDELSGPFDPAKHPDEYRNAVLAAVDEKVEAGQIARESGAEAEPAAAAAGGAGAQVIDLAELLSRSISAAGKPGPAKAKAAEEEAGEGHGHGDGHGHGTAEKSKGGGARRKRAVS
ncbi:MAG: Ku protein [Myxococcales bacterium]|nr:Ku protein [Myxococcales bacterium]